MRLLDVFVLVAGHVGGVQQVMGLMAAHFAQVLLIEHLQFLVVLALAAGLAFVLAQERLKVRSYRISAKKQPRILNAGSALGEGYDILSYDRRGEELRIAVRITTGSENESFSVSEAERRVSAMDPAHFRLYRVYAFDPAEGTGKYSVFKGDLTPFCVNPERYRIML